MWLLYNTHDVLSICPHNDFIVASPHTDAQQLTCPLRDGGGILNEVRGKACVGDGLLAVHILEGVTDGNSISTAHNDTNNTAGVG